MPIKSYLAHPHDGQKQDLIRSLEAMEQCEILPAENREVVVLVTDTSSKEEDERLVATLEKIPSLKFLSLVSGFNSPVKK